MAKYSPQTSFLGPEAACPKLGLGSQNLTFKEKQQQKIVGQNFAEMIHMSKTSISLEEGPPERINS